MKLTDEEIKERLQALSAIMPITCYGACVRDGKINVNADGYWMSANELRAVANALDGYEDATAAAMQDLLKTVQETDEYKRGYEDGKAAGAREAVAMMEKARQMGMTKSGIGDWLARLADMTARLDQETQNERNRQQLYPKGPFD